MRKFWLGSALSLSLALGACATHDDQSATLPDDLKTDLAVASAPAGAQRIRFVSAVEQIHTASPARKPAAKRKVSHPVAHRQPAPAPTIPDPIATMAEEMPEPVSTTESMEPEPTVIVQAPVEAPPVGRSDGSEAQGQGGGGLGGLIGGIIGAVVIRGGAGGIDHCDPRHDGRPPVIGQRPVFGMPVHTGRVLGGIGRRR